MSFDTLAPHYRWMERVLAGSKLQRCRTAFFDTIKPPQHALLMGEGNGRFLGDFAMRFPNAQIVCVDASHKMLLEAKCSINGGTEGRVTFIHANVFDWQPSVEKFDLVVTNFFLDCFNEQQLPGIIRKLASSTIGDASWLLADFCEPSVGWKKLRARWILASMYLFFRFATHLPAKRLAAPDRFLHEAGFRLAERKLFDWGLLHADLWVQRAEV